MYISTSEDESKILKRMKCKGKGKGSKILTDDLKWYMLRVNPDDNLVFDGKLYEDRWCGNLPRVSARDCSAIIGLSPFMSREDVLLEKSYIFKQRCEFTPDICRGIRLEPVALDEFSKFMGLDVKKCEVKQIKFPNFILSGRPDGVFTQLGREIVVEVKCPKRNSRKCPVAHYIQIQVYIYLYGSPYGYYVEYIDGRPLNILRIEANPDFMNSIWCHLSKFVEDVYKLRQVESSIKHKIIDYRKSSIVSVI